MFGNEIRTKTKISKKFEYVKSSTENENLSYISLFLPFLGRVRTSHTENKKLVAAHRSVLAASVAVLVGFKWKKQLGCSSLSLRDTPTGSLLLLRGEVTVFQRRCDQLCVLVSQHPAHATAQYPPVQTPSSCTTTCVSFRC